MAKLTSVTSPAPGSLTLMGTNACGSIDLLPLPADWRLMGKELPRNSMSTSAPLCLQQSLDEGQHSAASTEAGGNRTFCAQGVFPRFWETRGNEGTVCSIQGQRTVAEKQHCLSCSVAMKSPACNRICPVQEYRCRARCLSPQPPPALHSPRGRSRPPATEFCSVLTHWQLQTAKPSQNYTRPHASRSQNT